MASALSLVALSCLVGLTSSQCATSNNANCASWVTNGFCNNGAYTLAQKQAYCPNSCPVGCAGSPTVTTTIIPTTDQNTNCARWAANPQAPFCVNSMTAVQKRNYCAATCQFEITPNADCALYTSTGTVFARLTPVNRSTTTPATVVTTGVTTPTTITRSYTGPTCTITLYTEAAPTPGTTAALDTKVGTAGQFQTVTTGSAAASYTCTCT